MVRDKSGAFFIDRDPYRWVVISRRRLIHPSFSIILNYLRLQCSKQLWQAW